MSALRVDANQLSTFADALFRYASEGGHISLRAFLDLEDGPPVLIRSVKLNGAGIAGISSEAHVEAQRAASFIKPAVFCPPIASFSSASQAREQDLFEALALSVECDQRASKARERLEGLLGPATVVVASGGEWINPETGELELKLHLHWRLTEPATGLDLAKLKDARRFATAIVGGDPSNVPMVHPIRWPGSWHRKGDPRMAQILDLNDSAEIDLSDAFAALQAASPPIQRLPANDAHADEQADGRELSDLVRGVLTGEALHPNLTPLAARFVGAGMFPGAAVNTLRGMMEASAAPHDARWQARFDDLPRTVRTAEAKFTPVTRADLTRPLPQLALIDPAHWEGQLPPIRQWQVKDWIPAKQATYFTGAGSSGKSLAGQQMATSVAMGLPFLGVETRQGPALYLTCEDDADELHRRQDAICDALNLSFADLSGKLHLVSLAGAPGNELVTFDAQNRMETTPAWDRLRRTVLERRFRFIVLDNVAHLFAGNENIRVHVAGFVGLLNGLAAEGEAAVLFIGHPNKAGADFSGSTAWENQVRSRIFLKTPTGEDGAFVDPDARVLSREKSNYARRGEALTFRWFRWAFVRDEDLGREQVDSLTTHLLAKTQDTRFMACLGKATAEKRTTSPNSSAPNYAPRVFSKMPSGSGIGVAGFEAALHRLLDQGVILNSQRIYRRDNRSWATGLGPAQSAAQTPAQSDAQECTTPELSH